MKLYQIFALLLLIGLFSAQAFSWAYPEMMYRRAITINNTQNSNTLTDYQVLISMDTASLISQGKMRSDCGDIRFVDSDDQMLNAWIESGCNSTSTKIWVKVPTIPASSTKTIYVYYGYPSATLSSSGPTGEAPLLSSSYAQYDNGANVFLFYSNFAGTSLPSGWTISSGVVTVNNGLFISGSSVATTIQTTSAFGPSIVEWYGYATTPTLSYCWEDSGWYSNNGGNGWFTWNGHSTYGYGYTTASGSAAVTYTSTATGSSQNHTFGVINDGTNARYFLDYVAQSNTYAMKNLTNNIGFRNGALSSGGCGADVFVQWVRVRAYTSPEPNYTIGSEEIGLIVKGISTYRNNNIEAFFGAGEKCNDCYFRIFSNPAEYHDFERIWS